MNHESGVRPERRLHTRIAPKGTVLLHVLGHSTHGRIANIGAGGMFVLTRTKPPERLLARVVEIELRLDGAEASWLIASLRIVRLHADGLAMAFVGPPPAMFVRMLDELRTASHAHARVISVVMIDAAAQRRSAMAAGFRATGYAVIEAATPLEAIVLLGESTFEPDVIAIADTAAPRDAEEMRGFVERNHPNAKMITIGDDVFQPDGFANWLSSSNRDADLPRRLREALVSSRGPKAPGDR